MKDLVCSLRLRPWIVSGAVFVLTGLLFSVQAQADEAGGPDDCQVQEATFQKARDFYDRKNFEIAVELANAVEPLEKCGFAFVQAKGLIADYYVFEAKDYEMGIAAARKGLEADSRQTTLWFTQGYAQYQLESYQEAIESFRQVMRYYRIVPVPEQTLIEARYFIADAGDRASQNERLTYPQQAEELMKSVTGWQEFEDFCMDAECPELWVQRSDDLIAKRSRELQLLRLKIARGEIRPTPESEPEN